MIDLYWYWPDFEIQGAGRDAEIDDIRAWDAVLRWMEAKS